jgi:hypothetical protein
MLWPPPKIRERDQLAPGLLLAPPVDSLAGVKGVLVASWHLVPSVPAVGEL